MGGLASSWVHKREQVTGKYVSEWHQWECSWNWHRLNGQNRLLLHHEGYEKNIKIDNTYISLECVKNSSLQTNQVYLNNSLTLLVIELIGAIKFQSKLRFELNIA